MSWFLNYHEHQSAQCHITRSEFRAYEASQRKKQLRLRLAGIISDSRTSFHASNTRENYQLSANINSFAVNNFLAKFFELEYSSFWPINDFHLFTLCIHGNHE